MKINKLWVSKYKNLEDVDFEFKSDLVSLLVGNNGLGKSNLIEILIHLFKEIERIDTEGEMLDWATEYFQFELDYQNKEERIFFTLKDTASEDSTGSKLKLNISLLKLNSLNPNSKKELSFDEFKRIKNQFIPEFIVSYYSGENKRINDIVNTYKENEKARLVKLANKKGESVFDESFRRVFIAENIHSPLILLTISLYLNQGDEYEHFRKLIGDYLNIDSIVEFSIRFNNPNWNYKKLGSPPVNRSMDYLLSNVQSKVENPFWNLSGKLDRLLTRFYNYDVERGRDPIFYNTDDEYKKEFEEEILDFGNINIEKFSSQLVEIFEEPIEFFDALETTTFIDTFKDISFKIKKKDVDELISYKQLSEGEQQLLTTIGLLILFNDKETLFLFDEPDTHLNPSWQRDYVHLLENFNQGKEDNQMIVATHSPLIVQSSKNADVFLFTKGENKIIVDSEDHQIHNWRIDQVLVSKYFGLYSARPKFLDPYMSLREEILSSDEITEEKKELLESKQNEFGVLPTGETMADVRAMKLIRKLTKDSDDKA